MENQVLKNGDYVISRKNHSKVKAGKRYKVDNVEIYNQKSFTVILEEKASAFCLFGGPHGCTWLGGDYWEICNSPLVSFKLRFINFFKKLFNR